MSLKILLVVVTFLMCQTSFSRSTVDIEKEQTAFIFNSGASILATPLSKSKFTIAIIGSNRDTKKLNEYIQIKSKSSKIKTRQVSVSSYNKLEQTNNEDLIVFTAGMKLKLKELEAKLSNINYIVLTESKPFGIAFLNADNLIILANQSKLENENKKKTALLDDAKYTIDEQKDSIINQEKNILKKDEILGKNADTIENQSDVIVANSETIKMQNTIITIGTISFIIISALLFLLYKVNNQRKLNVIELKVKNKHITDSINYAKNIQNAILPESKYFSSAFKEHFVLFEPKDIVSGDFYWTEEHNGKLYFAVADCTGHGVPGAFLSLVCSSALSKVIKENNVLEPAKILDAVTTELEVFFSKNAKKIYDGMDISLIRFDNSKNEITFSGAHNSLLYIKSGQLNSLAADKQPVGAFEIKKPFTQQTINCDEIDSFYLFSDGYSDQFGGPKNKKFSKKRFKQLLIDNESKSMTAQYEILHNEFTTWRKDLEQIDDVTVVGFKINKN